MGDFNIDLLKYSSETAVQNFVSLMTSYSFQAIITKPTRITPHSSTLIDNIFTNDYSVLTPGILITDISDHLPIFVSLSANLKKSASKSTQLKRDTCLENIQNLINDLRETKWQQILIGGSVNAVYKSFHKYVMQLYKRNIPLREVKYRFNKK